jgi:hypothetical protein
MSEELQKKIHWKIKKYPFRNVHYFGLDNYLDKFPLIRKLRNQSMEHLYKVIARESLYSIQRFYQSKIQSLDKYQN